MGGPVFLEYVGRKFFCLLSVLVGWSRISGVFCMEGFKFVECVSGKILYLSIVFVEKILCLSNVLVGRSCVC